MSTPRRRGQIAEQLALEYLQQQGMRLLRKNFHCRRGEIDLIMHDGEYTVFVEVRYRKPSAFADAVASIDWNKQQKLIAAAQYYLLQEPRAASRPCRFDVVAITPEAGQNRVEWLINAIET